MTRQVSGDKYRANPAIPFIFVHGSDSFTVNTTPTKIDFDHCHQKTDNFHFIDGTSRMTLMRGMDSKGVYMVYAQAGATPLQGAPLKLTLEIYKNGTVCECGAGHGGIGAGKVHSDATVITALYLEKGDYVEAFVHVDAGAAALEDDVIRCIISAISMNGWNNNSQGTIRYRGGVNR